MKKLSTTPISDSAKMPLKKGTLQFLQDANLEVVAATMKALIGSSYNPATVYVMFGCVNTGTDPNYIISAGAVFYQEEVFLVDATSFSVSGNTAIFQIITTQYSTFADPVTFSDATVHNIHDIRKVQILAGTTGTGIADFSQLYRLNFVIPPQLNATGAGVSGSYPNLVFAGPSGLNPVLGAGSLNIGDVPAGGKAYTVTFGTALATDQYYIQGSLLSQSVSPDLDTTVIWAIRTRATTGFTIFIHETGNWTQDLAFEYILFAK